MNNETALDMTWASVVLQVRQVLDGQGCQDAWDVGEAIDEVERLMRLYMPGVIGYPKILLARDKAFVIDTLETDRVFSEAERCVLDTVYQVVRQGDIAPVQTNLPKTKRAEHKLEPLASCISKIFEQFFNCNVSYTLEAQPAWLPSVPEPNVYEAVWEDVSAVYEALVEHRWTLTDRLQAFSKEIRGGQQRVDIWFQEPFNCVVEFDETQHFNTFRLQTLQTWNGYSACSFDVAQYLKLAQAVPVFAGTTPFQRLKNFDPLFPPLLGGDAQDNRIRQRAFRDFLKDITPLVVPQINPTLRISYWVTNGRIRDFTDEDLEAVGAYLRNGRFLERMRLGR